MTGPIPETHWLQYLAALPKAASESARSHLFAILISQLFGAEPSFIGDYVSGIEKSVKARSSDRVVRGQIDNLYGNVIIEFERDLKKTLAEAEHQLKEYASLIRASGDQSSYLCIATDGVRFIVYTPTYHPSLHTKFDITVTLTKIDELHARETSPDDAWLWLDRHFARGVARKPTSAVIVADFGLESHAFNSIMQELRLFWSQHGASAHFAVVYETWQRYLRVVYGTDVGDSELFLRHTYLATIAKLLCWQLIVRSAEPPDEKSATAILGGTFFTSYGISNLLDEDFFSWTARPEGTSLTKSMVRRLSSLLARFRIAEINEDVLKGLYQQLVDPATRHDLGEFYTPDWLAAEIVEKILADRPQKNTLDPACGSGTFLYFLVKKKREAFGTSEAALEWILESVVGIDVHPLAIIISKTNFILALGDLLYTRTTKITLPVFFADSLRLPSFERLTLLEPEESVTIFLDGEHARLPAAILESTARFDLTVSLLDEYASLHSEATTRSLQSFAAFLGAQTSDEAILSRASLLFALASVLADLRQRDRDSIWAFILRNVYRPYFLMGLFDAIVGNRPWIAYRQLSREYQRYLKQLITRDYKLLENEPHLVTHLEIATLFLVFAADVYARKDATLAFVLPRSILNTAQHDGLRQLRFRMARHPARSVVPTELWDLEHVRPLFNIPACVMFCQITDLPSALDVEDRKGGVFPLSGVEYSGHLREKNASLFSATLLLTRLNTQFFLNTAGNLSFLSTEVREGESITESPYKALFKQGATILPRSFWFIEAVKSTLGGDAARPMMKTAALGRAGPKSSYRDFAFMDTVESEFLYATILGDHVLPFNVRDASLTILPLFVGVDGIEVLDFASASSRGFVHLAKWLHRIQAKWSTERGAKAEGMTAVERIDYHRGLSVQSPRARFRVVYPNFQRVSLAAVVDAEAAIRALEQRAGVVINGLLVDHSLYYFETDDEDEAYYLCGVLNSGVVDSALGELRRKEQGGHPNVHKKVFEVVSLPLFDADSSPMLQLSRVSKEISQRVSAEYDNADSKLKVNLGRIRSYIRASVADDLQILDDLVRVVTGA